MRPLNFPAVGNNTKAVMEALGVPLTPTARGFTCPCPLPDHTDANPSCHVYVDARGDHGWYCFGCSRGGDAILLVSLIYNIDRMQATLTLLGAQNPEAILKARLQQGQPTTEHEPAVLMLYLRANILLRHCRHQVETSLWDRYAAMADEAIQRGDIGSFGTLLSHLNNTLQTIGA